MISHQNAVFCCYLVAFMDLFAVGMLLPLFNRRGRELGASPSTLGVIGSIYGGLQFFSSPYMGKVSDKWGRKPVLLLSLIGCLVGYFMMGVTDTLFFFALSRLPTGILKHSQTSVKAYLSDITLPEERARIFGRLNAIGSLGFIIAPVIGGTVAMQENGFFKVSLMTCTVYLLGFGFVLFVFENKKIKKEERNGSMRISSVSSKRKNSDAALEDAVKQRQKESSTSNLFSFLKINSVQHVLDLFLIRFVMALSMLIYRNNYTSMLDYRFGIDAKMTGYTISYGSIAAGISGMLVGSIYDYVKSDAKMMFFSAVLMTISLFGIAISPSVYTVLVCVAPLSLSTAMMRVNSHNLVLKRIRPEEKGAVMGVGDSMTSFSRMLSPAIAGFAQEVSVTAPCWLATCCAVIGVGFMITFLRDDKIAGKKTD